MVEWKVRGGLALAARPPGHDSPRMKRKQRWSHEKENGCGGASAGVGVQGWGSAAGHTAWPGGRVVAHSASRTPAASLLGHNGCTPPGRSHHGQGIGRRWTCLIERRETYLSHCKMSHSNVTKQPSIILHYEKVLDLLT